jgi:hypothetical protein
MGVCVCVCVCVKGEQQAVPSAAIAAFAARPTSAAATTARHLLL